MTKPRDPEALLSAYLADGMKVLPDRVVDSVLDEVHRTRQRAGFASWTTRPGVRTAFAAAAVVGVIVVGGAFFMIQRGQPAVVANPSPTPSADPSPSLPAVLAPSPTPGATATDSSAFPPSTGVWIATGSMGTPRSGHTAVRLLDGRVLVAGGYPADEPDHALTSAELYDPDTGTWSATGNMLKPHDGFHAGFPATLLRDGMVLVGDVDDPGADKPVNGAEVYDPASGTWTATGPMVTPDKYASAVLLRDGKVLVVHEFGSSELYDPDSGAWTATGQMLEYFHQSRAMVLMPDGKVLEVGGNDGTAYVGYAAELYDPDTGTWTATGKLNSPKEVVSATLLRDGRVLVLDLGSITTRPPELYDPATGTWTEIGLPGNRYQSATLLADGMVLVAGDVDSPDAELYDPATNAWITTGSMLREHPSARLTLLLDGTVLVAGGATGAAELYIPAGVSPPAHAGSHPEPDPTPVPSPTPVPTFVPPAVGPVPPGARSWTVRVVNGSARPATLFVAEDGDGGMGRLVGRVTPNVVPPGATVNVTFRLPPKRATGWSIFVNSGPDTGGLLTDTSVPLAGEIRIGPDGQPGWLSP